MASAEIRVLVVDDSAVVRSIIADSIAATAGMKVVGTAGDGCQAMALLDALRPDVITLDIQMPNMDGLATLDAILARRPVPVVMVSSLTKLGANITLEALDRGAVDYLAKPDYGAKTRSALRDELPRKIRTAAGLDVRRILEIRQQRKQRRAEAEKGTDPLCRNGSRPVSGQGPASHKSDISPFRSWPTSALPSASQLGGLPPCPPCSSRFGPPCRPSSWYNTCRPVSPSHWPGGSIRWAN